MLEAIADPTGYVDTYAHEIARLQSQALLARWGAARTALTAALRDYPPGQKMPWFGPPMSPASMATARFMETWAHGLDVYDALGIHPETTDRIRHVAHLGIRTRDFAFGVHELDASRRGVPGRADRALGRALDLGTGRRRAAGRPARRTTSACWSPSGSTATTPTCSPRAPTPRSG